MFQQFCSEAGVDTSDEHTMTNFRLVWYSSFLNFYNYSMEAIRRDSSLRLFSHLTEAYRLDMTKYFEERQAANRSADNVN